MEGRKEGRKDIGYNIAQGGDRVEYPVK